MIEWLPRLVARIRATIHAKLLLAFLAIVLLLLAVGGVGLRALNEVNQRAEQMVQLQRKIAAYRQLNHDTIGQLYSVATALLQSDAATLDATLRQLQQFGYDLDRLQFVAKGEIEVMARVRGDYEEFIRIVSRSLELIRAGRADEGRELQATAARPLAERLERLTNELVNKAESDMVTGIEASQAAHAHSRRVVIAFALGSILLALLLGYAISWSLIGPVRQMTQRMREIAAGDFSQRVPIVNRDELGALATDMNRMSEQLGQLYGQLEARNKAISEALEQQTATAEILRVISQSHSDVQPVFEAIAVHAQKLCRAETGWVFTFDGKLINIAASHSVSPEALEVYRRAFPMAPGRGGSNARAILTGTVVYISDVREDAEYELQDMARAAGHRSALSVPMLREGDPIGTITVTGAEPAMFSPRQIAMLQTFADQAVIAIENARLFHEIEDKNRQLEVANEHKSDFLASMSHELRTPLNAVIGFSEVLNEGMFGELNAKQTEYIRDIHASGHHLLSLINDVLDLSKVEAGRMELEVSKFDVPAAVDNAVVLIRERAHRHQIALDVHLDQRLNSFAGDERKFKQILLNLLSNAVKFTPSGGRVAVAADATSDGVQVSVSDTGVGIAPEDQQLIFEAFQQAGADRATKREGTGLGLTLTKRFVEMHGGRLWLASEPGKGSTFTFTLVAQPWQTN